MLENNFLVIRWSVNLFPNFRWQIVVVHDGLVTHFANLFTKFGQTMGVNLPYSLVVVDGGVKEDPCELAVSS
jgi:hypothetical protein